MAEDFIDGITYDYAEQVGDRLGSMELGMIHCARIAHGIQEAVDPRTGDTHAVLTPEGQRQWRDLGGNNDFCIPCWMRREKGDGDTRCKIHHPPDRRGMCMACWIEMQKDSKYAFCTLHGHERKIKETDGCPICFLDPFEREKREEHDAKIADVARVQQDDNPLANPADPRSIIVPAAEPTAVQPPTIVVVDSRTLVSRHAALAQRIAARRQAPP